MGNDLHAFSKIGDCQNLKTVFLWKFDHLDIYEFEWDITPYLDTIKNFQGSFDRDGQSAQYGFTAASPLTQIQAAPEFCQPDETPMECELRITRPTFVLVSLAFPFNGRTPGLYEQYLRRIIEYSMAQGAVPILATKADNVEKDNSINLAVAKLAYEYDLPLWNWWAAAQPLADNGIDPYRDGFHISELTRLTTRSQDDWGPKWSADGSHILFFSNLGNYNWEIFVMNADGSRVQQITSDELPHKSYLKWSPDGTQILFVSQEGGLLSRTYDVYILQSDGSMLTHLIGPLEKNPSPICLQ